jgi:hypothetical protein
VRHFQLPHCGMCADQNTDAHLRTATAQLLNMRRKYDTALVNVEIAQTALDRAMLLRNAASARYNKWRSLHPPAYGEDHDIVDANDEAARAVTVAADELEMAKIEPAAVAAEVQAAVLAVEIATRRHSMRTGAPPTTTAPAPAPAPAPTHAPAPVRVYVYDTDDDGDRSDDGDGSDYVAPVVDDAPPAYADS